MNTEKAVADTPTETTETALCSRDTKQLMVRAPHELAGLCRVPDSGGREGGDLVVLEMQSSSRLSSAHNCSSSIPEFEVRPKPAGRHALQARQNLRSVRYHGSIGRQFEEPQKKGPERVGPQGNREVVKPSSLILFTDAWSLTPCAHDRPGPDASSRANQANQAGRRVPTFRDRHRCPGRARDMWLWSMRSCRLRSAPEAAMQSRREQRHRRR